MFVLPIRAFYPQILRKRPKNKKAIHFLQARAFGKQYNHRHTSRGSQVKLFGQYFPQRDFPAFHG
jgi:hypothetical protein